ncbi:MAG: PD40 domain-containing protein, partial [Chloroflexi bacterium]|nr:PD40 domain-containing protein [Chloroflexota bacterium]
MAAPQTAPYGSWKSPVTSDIIVAGSISIGQTALDGDDVYWIEQRPSEGGRNVIVRRTPDGQASDVTPPAFNVRTTVHEYGGGAYVVAGGTVYFSNYEDQRLYRQRPGEQPQPLTPETNMRYADGVIDHRRNRMVCVREDHTSPWQEAVNTLATIDLDTGAARVLVSGSSFYSSPRLSPDGSRLTWLAWNHPNMPWDGTALWVGELNSDGSLGATKRVAGGPDESIFQPEWSPDGVLHFVSDRTGWWNLYRWRDEQVEPLHEMEAEFGVPEWVFGISMYGFASANRIICAYNQRGAWHIADLDTQTLKFQNIPTPFTEITRSGLRVSPERVVFGAGSPTMPDSLMLHDLSDGQTETLRRSNDVAIDEGCLSSPEAIEFPTENGLTAHAFFYPPQHSDS